MMGATIPKRKAGDVIQIQIDHTGTTTWLHDGVKVVKVHKPWVEIPRFGRARAKGDES